jgi:glycerol transport system ATP-binding protein
VALILKDVNYTVENEMYLQDVNLRFEPGSFNVLLGRTRAGKTSLMRVIAGLDKPTTGTIHLAGRDITHAAVQKRNVSMVYQQFINYPNMTVAENIASPLVLAKRPKKEIEQRVKDTAALLHMSEYLNRYPLELSGGQQQRCAMARALVKDADIILFDEPLVNLDYKLRESLRTELKTLFEERNCVAIYATTEAQEALALGGTTTLLHQGKVLQSGSASHQYSRPVNLDAADLFHEPSLNLFSGTLKSGALDCLGQSINVNELAHLRKLADGDYTLAVRADQVSVNAKSDGESFHLYTNAVVDLAEIGASETYLHTRSGELSWVVVMRGVHPMHTQTPVKLAFNPQHLTVFDQQGRALAWPHSASGSIS